VLEVTGGLLLLYGIGATIGPILGGSMMDWLGPESLMLYFCLVLVGLALGVWRFAGSTVQGLGALPQKSDYVLMGGGSQAVLQMDPRRAQEVRPPAPVAAPPAAPRD
jgi:predicted MFS family arabinose efflux permease